MASGQTPNKISPRKFSEKIALLNKKEAEGNAEFEEIIKEVQATRTHSANESASKCAKRNNNNNNNSDTRTGVIVSNTGDNEKSVEQWRSEERLELEEVFQSLIKSVGTYQEDDHNHQQQQASESIRTAGSTIQSRSLSAGPPTGRDNTFRGVPQNSMTTYGSNGTFPSVDMNASSLQDSNIISGQTQGRILSNDLNSSSNFPIKQYPFQSEQQQQQQISTTSQSDIHLIPGTTDGSIGLEQIQDHNISTPITQTACRARFSSIGSSMYKSLFANKNNNNNNNDQNDSSNCLVPTINNGHQMYLRPNNDNQQQSGCLAATSDKNWPQKSCSDPTLNMLVQVNQTQNNYTTINSNLNARMICDQDGARNHTETGCYQYHQIQAQQEPNDYQISDDITSCFEQQQQQMSNSQKISPIACYENVVQRAADVPGINICTIEDESSSLFRPPDPNQQQQQDSSLPDLANLQFASPEDVVNYVPGLQQQQQIHQISNPAYCDQNQTINNNDNNNFVQLDNNYDRNTYKGEGVQNVSQTILTSNNGNYWTSATVAESLYAPKVNNSLSVSECGLTTCSQVSGTDLIQSNFGIMRSHSHNSIDNLTRRTTGTAYSFNKQHNNTPTNINYIQTNQTSSQPNQNMMSGFGHNHLRRQQLTFDSQQQQQQQQQQQVNNFTNQQYQDQFLGLQTNDCSFVGSSNNNCSIEPLQHGSVSPLNSSLSNLTSPQSEQNSPGSSNNDYLDYLPYSTSATANQLQTQNNMMTTGFTSSQQQQYLDNDNSIALRDKTTATNDQIEICNRQGEEVTGEARGTDVIMLHQPVDQNGACILAGSTGLLPAIGGGQNCNLYQQQQRVDINNNNNSYQMQYTLSDQELNNRKQFQHSGSAFMLNQQSNVIITQQQQQQQQQQQLSNCRAYSNSSASLRNSPSEQNR